MLQNFPGSLNYRRTKPPVTAIKNQTLLRVYIAGLRCTLRALLVVSWVFLRKESKHISNKVLLSYELPFLGRTITAFD